MNLNTVTLIGHVTQEPLSRQISEKSALTKFTVATNARRVGKDGQPNAEFHPVVAFGKLAEICRDYVHKGRLVYVQGRLKTSRWEDDKKQMHARTEIIASNMLLLDKQQALVSAGTADTAEADATEAMAEPTVA